MPDWWFYDEGPANQGAQWADDHDTLGGCLDGMRRSNMILGVGSGGVGLV